MIIDYDGQQYPFDMNDITVRQALAIEKFMGCSFAEWGRKLQGGGDLKARQAVGWLILHKGSADVPICDTDFKMMRLGHALAAAFAAEAKAAGQEEEDGPVPTAAASNGHASAASSPESSRPFSAAILP